MDGLVKISAERAEEICRHFEPSAAAAALLARHPATADFLVGLLAARLWQDAVRLLAFGLPRRKAVWWACLCARAALPAEPATAPRAALAAAEAWVFKPSEDSRRATEARARAAGFQVPASWAALAAFWSDGSMAAAGAPEVLPDEALTPTAVAAAVHLAAVAEPRRLDERFRRFLEWGIDIAQGGRGHKGEA